MSSGTVVAAGWHDTYFRWEISTPQRIVSRLQQLPGQGSVSVGRKLYAERDRFGTWQHVLGPQNVLVSWAVDTPKHGLIRRLEVQAHLGDSGEDDLCAGRRALARDLGVSPGDAEVGALDVSLDELLAVPRSAWAAA